MTNLLKINRAQTVMNLQDRGPSLSGHSQQRRPSLMWPQISGAASMNAFTSPSRRKPPLSCGHNFLAK